MNIEAGVRLGRYRLVQQLGRGGMGTVWKAVDTTLDRHVAVKILHERHLNDQKQLSRFLREAVALSRLAHPGVAGIHLVDELAGLPYFVMDYIEGESLERMISADFRLPAKRALDILIAVADALDAVHAAGIIHRDVKPANIIVRKGAPPALIDFSVARVDTWTSKAAVEGPLAALEDYDKHDTGHEKIAGTPAFVSPERWLRGEYDTRADIYSFGVMMFQLLTGNLPFDAPEISEIRELHVRGPVPLPQPGLHPSAAAVISRCLKKAPGDRFGTAAELRSALKRAAEDISPPELLPPRGGAPREVPSALDAAPISFHAPVFAPRAPMPNLIPFTRAASVILLCAVMICALFIPPMTLMKKLGTALEGARRGEGGIPTAVPGIALDEGFSDRLLERRFRITGRVVDFRRLSDGAWIRLKLPGGDDLLLWSPGQRAAVRRGAVVTARGMLVKNRAPESPEYFIYVEKESDIAPAGGAIKR